MHNTHSYKKTIYKLWLHDPVVICRYPLFHHSGFLDERESLNQNLNPNMRIPSSAQPSTSLVVIIPLNALRTPVFIPENFLHEVAWNLDPLTVQNRDFPPEP